MKKFMAMFLMAAMLANVASVAGAVSIGESKNFEIYVQCRNSNTYMDETEVHAHKDQDSEVKAIYVRHWVTGGSSSYTNHFRGRKYVGDGLVTCGTKWCTVGANIPIQSNSIVGGNDYTIAGRGNTNHYDYDGVSNVTLHGNMYVNASYN